jgi:hypothetical protein
LNLFAVPTANKIYLLAVGVANILRSNMQIGQFVQKLPTPLKRKTNYPIQVILHSSTEHWYREEKKACFTSVGIK